MALWSWLKFWREPEAAPEHILAGRLGEAAAKKYLCGQGLKFLTANFKARRGEIDLVFRDRDCLVFVEVKTRSAGGWTRPARAVNLQKKRALARAAAEYLRLLEDARVPFRFDVVEVILEHGAVREVRHLPNSFDTRNLWRRTGKWKLGRGIRRNIKLSTGAGSK